MRPNLRKLLPAIVFGLVLATLALLAFTRTKSAPLAAWPNPNGYDDFLRAANALRGDIGNYDTPKHDDLRALVLTNEETLRLVRVGLGHRCIVPIDFSQTNSSALLNDLPKFKSLAHLLAAEGSLAEMENRPTDAARSYVDTIRFGNEIGRGGFMIQRLVGIGFEALGRNRLVKLAPDLDPARVRQIITALEEIDAARADWNEVRRAESAYSRHALRQTLNPVPWLLGWWQTRAAKQKAEEKHKNIVVRVRLLTAELALRCYQSEQRGPPERLDQLVPKYLQRAPSDPFSGKLLMYRTQGTNWLLYSVGPDGVDDNGRAVGRSVAGQPNPGDLFFDSPW